MFGEKTRWQARLVGIALLFMLALELQPAPAFASTVSCCPYTDIHASSQPLQLSITPRSPTAGDVIVVHATFQDAMRVVGQFGTHLLRFHPSSGLTVTQSNNAEYVALVGLDALLPRGTYSLAVTAYDEHGGYGREEQNVRVLPRASTIESLRLSPALSPTLDPAANRDESAQFSVIYSGFTESKLWSGAFRWPIQGRLSSGYGNRRVYNGVNLGTYHGGYDIVAGTGTPVKPAAPGLVVIVKQFLIHGLSVVLDHGDGVYTTYSHLSKVYVSVGQMITNTNQVLGEVGTTGRSQGPHLHFELAVGGVPVDPGPWLRAPLP